MLTFKQYMEKINEVAITPTVGVTGSSKSKAEQNLIARMSSDKTLQDALAKGDEQGAQRRSDQIVQTTPEARQQAEMLRRRMLKLASTSIARIPQLLGAATR